MSKANLLFPDFAGVGQLGNCPFAYLVPQSLLNKCDRDKAGARQAGRPYLPQPGFGHVLLGI